jgi:hypothetical protein
VDSEAGQELDLKLVDTLSNCTVVREGRLTCALPLATLSRVSSGHIQVCRQVLVSSHDVEFCVTGTITNHGTIRRIETAERPTRCKDDVPGTISYAPPQSRLSLALDAVSQRSPRAHLAYKILMLLMHESV